MRLRHAVVGRVEVAPLATADRAPLCVCFSVYSSVNRIVIVVFTVTG
jgi:hypothetical protein